MKEKNNRSDGRTIELVRRGILNANSGKIDKNRAIKNGLIPTKGIPTKGKNKGGKTKC